MADIQYPFGPANTSTIVAAGLTQTFTITDQSTIITSEALTGNLVLVITADTALRAGADLLLKVTSGSATQSVTFSGSIVAPVVTNPNTKTFTQGFRYNGTSFYPVGAKIQID